MNKKLSPGILFLLSLVLLYFGGTLGGGAIGIALSIGGFVCLVFAIVGGIKKLFNSNDIEQSTRGTAKVMLSSFLAVQRKHNYPLETAADKVRVYSHVLRLRPGYTPAVIKDVLTQAQELSDIKRSTQGISLNTLVFVMVVREYVLDTNKRPTEEQLAKVKTILNKMF